MRRLRFSYRPFVGVVLLGAIWEAVARVGVFDEFLFPSASGVLRAMWVEVRTGALYLAIIATTWKALAAFVGAVVVGVPVGFLIGSSRVLREAVFPLIDFMRSVPATALIPVFILFFGLDWESRVAIAFYPCVFLVLIGTFYGVTSASLFRAEVVRFFGGSSWDVFRHASFFEAIPSILGAMRISLSTALVLVIVAELIIPQGRGIGTSIHAAQQAFSPALMFSRILVAGLVGYALNVGFVVLERQLVYWRPSDQERDAHTMSSL